MLRQQLEESPPPLRSPAQYEAVLNAFRRIYHDNPTAAKAPAAVAAVADLLAEKGRLLHDPKSLRAAIGQYEFLLQQYPDSPQVANALLLEAEICRQDLGDGACAADKLHQVIANSPGSSFAEQAALELAELNKVDHPRSSKQSLRSSPTSGAKAAPEQTIEPLPTSPPTPPAAANPSGALNPSAEAPQTTSVSHPIVMINGMRHWSNPTSTRIAIDLGGKVEYEAARVPKPDRIFFDLHGARLAPNLNGHEVEVIDDGYLKRIRAAQFHPDVTRVVLDVTDVSQYSAFLLPNPWRLIIDIHSDKSATSSAIAKSKLSIIGPPDTAQSSTPSRTGTSVAAPNPANTPPKSSITAKPGNDSTLADVARLSSASGKIPATAGPTSSPVSAKVASSEADVADSTTKK